MTAKSATARKHRGLTSIAVIVIVLFWRTTHATESTLPPITPETLVGVWEAIPIQPMPTQIVHMSITPGEKSYLASIVLGSSHVSLFRLISSEVQDGSIKLKFRNVIDEDEPRYFSFEGHGEGSAVEGALKGRLWTNIPPEPKENNVFFVKGTWIRELARVSKRAEEAIRNARHSERGKR